MPAALSLAATALTTVLTQVPTTATTMTVQPLHSAAVVATAPAAGSSGGSYTVRRGDTVGKIARRTGVSVSAIVSANKLTRGGYRIHPGQVLVIPGAAAHSPAPKAKPVPKKPANPPVTPKAGSPKGTTTTTKKSAKTPVKTTKPTKAVTVKPVKAKPAPADKALASGLVPAKGYQSVVATINSTSKARGLDNKLALAISYQESRWDQARVSNKGALGAMQIMPANAAWLSQMSGKKLNLRDTGDNVTAGVVLLKWLDKQAKGNQDLTIGAYYQGMPSMKKRGPYSETSRYIAQVKSHKSKIAASSQAGLTGR